MGSPWGPLLGGIGGLHMNTPFQYVCKVDYNYGTSMVQVRLMNSPPAGAIGSKGRRKSMIPTTEKSSGLTTEKSSNEMKNLIFFITSLILQEDS